ncbi:Uncharacterised protein [Mycobacteroides abscessus subsp. abscessus]|nr:Uncharacterised protein [Mycobacteroides abscessus subsp. abscessus]
MHFWNDQSGNSAVLVGCGTRLTMPLARKALL